MARAPELGAEEAAAENVQGSKYRLGDGTSKLPESTSEMLEMMDEKFGSKFVDENGEEMERAWMSWDKGDSKPIMFVRVSDLEFSELRELGELGFEPYKTGQMLWMHEGEWDRWSHFEDREDNWSGDIYAG